MLQNVVSPEIARGAPVKSIAASPSPNTNWADAIYPDLPRDIERWPLSQYVLQEQVEEWCHSETNRNVNQGDRESKTRFLQAKIDSKGFNHYHRYMHKLGLPLRGRILEIGAGNFWLSSYLSSFSAVEHVVGVELAGERISTFRDVAIDLFPGAQRSKITYAVGDMHSIARPDDTFDYIVCDAVLHHADNLVAMLRECRRCLRPGGWFVAFREPTISRFFRKPPVFDERTPENGTAQYYYPDGWRSAFLNGRYTNVRFTPFYEYFRWKGIRFPWAAQRVGRTVRHLIGRLPYPKVCIAAQKPQ